MGSLPKHEYEFTYAGFNSRTDLHCIVGRVSKPLSPQMNEVTQSIPGKYGNLYTGTNYESMIFNIPITIMAKTAEEYNAYIENMRKVFINLDDEKGVEYPLVFGDRPEVTYYGHWTSLPTPEFLTPTDFQAQCTLTFTCSNPYGFLPEEMVKLNQDQQIFIPKGNGYTYPKYYLNVNKDVNNLGYAQQTHNGYEYVATGYTVDIDNTDEFGHKITNKEPLVVNEPDSDLSQWITDASVTHQFKLENGEIDGSMDTYPGWGIGPARHKVKNQYVKNQKGQMIISKTGNMEDHFNFGNQHDHNKWYGPVAVHPNITNRTRDWQVAFKIRHVRQYLRAMGKIEIYLLDQGMNRRGMIWVKDISHGKVPHMGIQLGDGSPNNTVEMLKQRKGDGSNDISNDYVGPDTVGGTTGLLKQTGTRKVVPLTVFVKQKRYVAKKKSNRVKNTKGYKNDISLSNGKPYTKEPGTSESTYVKDSKALDKANYAKIHKLPVTGYLWNKRTKKAHKVTIQPSDPRYKKYHVEYAYEGKVFLNHMLDEESVLVDDKKKKKKKRPAKKSSESKRALTLSLRERVLQHGLNPDDLELRYGVKRHKKAKKKTKKRRKTKTTKKKATINKKKTGGKKSGKKRKPKKPPVKIKNGKWVDSDTSGTNKPKGTIWQYRDKEINQIVNQLHKPKGEAWYLEGTKSVLTDMCATVYLRKVGDHFSCWIQMNENGEAMPMDKPIAKRDFYDKDNEFNFIYNTCALYTAKHNIDDDRVTPSRWYDDTKIGLQGYQAWNIIDGGKGAVDKPQIIAQQGDQVIIDTETMQVYKSGVNLTQFVSFASTFPPLEGGQPNNLSFNPKAGNDCNVWIQYRPTIK